MNIVITGASGFVGSCLVKRLLSDHILYCPVRNVGALPVHPQVKGIELDLAGPRALSGLPQTVDAVIHLAQSRNFRKFPDKARDIFEVNIGATFQLLEYARQAKARVFVFASSGGVCGYQPHPISETDPPQLMNFYLASKYAAECLVQAYGDLFTTVMLRYFFVYGEGQRDMFLQGLVTRVLEGWPVTITGQTGVSMNPIHVSDAVEATCRALEVPRQETFNVAGEEVTTIRDLAELIGQLTGKRPVYQFESDKGPMGMVANIEKMKLKLGVCPKVLLKEGIERLVTDLMNGGKGKLR